MSAASPPADARRQRARTRLDTRTGYARLLRLRHINLGFYPSLLLFEGSVAVGAVLAFGDGIHPLGAVAIPVAVAVMVKFNDVVAGLLARPVAEAQLRRSRSAPVVVGRSPVPRPSRLTQWIDRDDAVPYEMPADDEPRDGAVGGVARGVAAVPDARRPPAPGVPADDAAIAFDPAEPFELTGFEPTADGVSVDRDPSGDTATEGGAATTGGDAATTGGDAATTGGGDPATEWTGDERRERIGAGGEPVADERTGDDLGRPGSEPPGRGNVGRFLR